MLTMANPNTRALEAALSRDKVRLWNPATRQFLHLDGATTTRDVFWSWLGLRRQADALRTRTEARGDDWPFIMVHRDDMEPVAQVCHG